MGIQTLIQAHLTNSDKALLDSLVENQSPADDEETRHRYPLTELKQISQAMNPKSIAERVALFHQIKALFTPLAPLIARLDLTDDTIQYYAQYVLDNRSVRMADRVHERYLRLLAFITYQYLSVGDALILTLLKAGTGVFTDCEHTIKEEYYQSRQATASLVGQVSRRSDVHIDALTEIEQTVDKLDWTSDLKISVIRQILDRKRLTSGQLLADKQRVAELKTINQPIDERTDYYQALEKASFRCSFGYRPLCRCCSSIWRVLTRICWKPVTYYQVQKGELTASSSVPLDFLDMA